EDVQVRAGPNGEPNTFEARVESVTFVGSFFRVDLGGEPIAPSRLRADLTVDLARQLDLEQGRSLQVALPPARLRVDPQAAPGAERAWGGRRWAVWRGRRRRLSACGHW